jgi:hypothetical protein
MEVKENGRDANPELPEGRKRFRSEIEFPYADLENAVEVAQTLHSKAGTSCEIEELAAWMNQSATGGTFRTRISAAKMFGLIETLQGRATLTQLGRAILDKDSERQARCTAFLNAELFAAMYEQHKGNSLPPPAAIERQMEGMGVSPKQKERARQTFMKSAHYAGFIDPSSGRFIKPGFGASKEDNPPPPLKQDEGGGGYGGGGGGNGTTDDLTLDPLLIALLKKIPPSGTPWPAAQRIRWFRTFAMNVSQIYDDEDKPVEMEIKPIKAEDLFG